MKTIYVVVYEWMSMCGTYCSAEAQVAFTSKAEAESWLKNNPNTSPLLGAGERIDELTLLEE